MLLHRDAFKLSIFFTQKLLHREASTQSRLYMPLRKAAVRPKRLYTQKYTQKLLH